MVQGGPYKVRYYNCSLPCGRYLTTNRTLLWASIRVYECCQVAGCGSQVKIYSCLLRSLVLFEALNH